MPFNIVAQLKIRKPTSLQETVTKPIQDALDAAVQNSKLSIVIDPATLRSLDQMRDVIVTINTAVKELTDGLKGLKGASTSLRNASNAVASGATRTPRKTSGAKGKDAFDKIIDRMLPPGKGGNPIDAILDGEDSGGGGPRKFSRVPRLSLGGAAKILRRGNETGRTLPRPITEGINRSLEKGRNSIASFLESLEKGRIPTERALQRFNDIINEVGENLENVIGVDSNQLKSQVNERIKANSQARQERSLNSNRKKVSRATGFFTNLESSVDEFKSTDKLTSKRFRKLAQDAAEFGIDLGEQFEGARTSLKNRGQVTTGRKDKEAAAARTKEILRSAREEVRERRAIESRSAEKAKSAATSFFSELEAKIKETSGITFKELRKAEALAEKAGVSVPDSIRNLKRDPSRPGGRFTSESIVDRAQASLDKQDQKRQERIQKAKNFVSETISEFERGTGVVSAKKARKLRETIDFLSNISSGSPGTELSIQGATSPEQEAAQSLLRQLQNIGLTDRNADARGRIVNPNVSINQRREQAAKKFQKNVDELLEEVAVFGEVNLKKLRRVSAAANRRGATLPSELQGLGTDPRFPNRAFNSAGLNAAESRARSQRNQSQASQAESQSRRRENSDSKKLVSNFTADAKRFEEILRKFNEVGAITTKELSDIRQIQARRQFVGGDDQIASIDSRATTKGDKPGQVFNRDVQSRIKATKDALKAAAAEADTFGSKVDLAFRRFAAFSLAAGPIFLVVGALRQGVANAIDFDREMVKLSQTFGTSGAGVDFLKKKVRELSVNLGVNSTELATSAKSLAQAGLSARDTQVALEAIAKTDLAPSFEGVKNTTEGAIAILNQFKPQKAFSEFGKEIKKAGIEAKDLEGVFGSINKVSSDFAVEASDIIDAIQRFGGAFASAAPATQSGIDTLNQLNAIFTTVRSTTRESAETIATGLRSITTELQSASTQDFLGKELGISLRDANDQFVGVYESIVRISSALEGVPTTDSRFSRVVEKLGGKRNVGKIIPALTQSDTLSQVLATAQSGASSLADQQGAGLEAIGRKLTIVGEQFNKFIGEVVDSPNSKALINLLEKFAGAFGVLSATVQPLIPALTALAGIKFAQVLAQIPAVSDFLKPTSTDNKVAGFLGINNAPGPIGPQISPRQRDRANSREDRRARIQSISERLANVNTSGNVFGPSGLTNRNVRLSRRHINNALNRGVLIGNSRSELEGILADLNDVKDDRRRNNRDNGNLSDAIPGGANRKPGRFAGARQFISDNAGKAAIGASLVGGGAIENFFDARRNAGTGSREEAAASAGATSAFTAGIGALALGFGPLGIAFSAVTAAAFGAKGGLDQFEQAVAKNARAQADRSLEDAIKGDSAKDRVAASREQAEAFDKALNANKSFFDGTIFSSKEEENKVRRTTAQQLEPTARREISALAKDFAKNKISITEFNVAAGNYGRIIALASNGTKNGADILKKFTERAIEFGRIRRTSDVISQLIESIQFLGREFEYLDNDLNASRNTIGSLTGDLSFRKTSNVSLGQFAQPGGRLANIDQQIAGARTLETNLPNILRETLNQKGVTEDNFNTAIEKNVNAIAPGLGASVSNALEDTITSGGFGKLRDAADGDISQFAEKAFAGVKPLLDIQKRFNDRFAQYSNEHISLLGKYNDLLNQQISETNLVLDKDAQRFLVSGGASFGLDADVRRRQLGNIAGINQQFADDPNALAAQLANARTGIAAENAKRNAPGQTAQQQLQTNEALSTFGNQAKNAREALSKLANSTEVLNNLQREEASLRNDRLSFLLKGPTEQRNQLQGLALASKLLTSGSGLESLKREDRQKVADALGSAGASRPNLPGFGNLTGEEALNKIIGVGNAAIGGNKQAQLNELDKQRAAAEILRKDTEKIALEVRNEVSAMQRDLLQNLKNLFSRVELFNNGAKVFDAAVANLGKAAERLENAEVKIGGNLKIEVIHNGNEVFAAIEPAVKGIVEKNIVKAFQNFSANKLKLPGAVDKNDLGIGGGANA